MIYKAANETPKAKAALEKAVASKDDFKEKSLANDALKDIEHWRHLVAP